MKKGRIVLPLLLVGSLTACQPGEDASSEPQSVEERAQARWDHMIAREYEQAWSYYTPGYRQTTSAEDFANTRRQRPLRWESATVVDRSCEEARCEVTVEVSYRVPNAPAGLSNAKGLRDVTETWIRTQDQWWYSDPG